jgi:hypothetical protein
MNTPQQNINIIMSGYKIFPRAIKLYVHNTCRKKFMSTKK